jgi:hypothetical protein
MLLVIESSITTGLAIGNVKGSADSEFAPLNSTPTTGPVVPGSGLAEGSHSISITSTASPWKLLLTFERIFFGNRTLKLCAIALKGFSNSVPAPILVEVIAYPELETVVGLLPSNAFLRLSADNPDMLSMIALVNCLCPDCLLISADRDLKVKLFRTWPITSTIPDISSCDARASLIIFPNESNAFIADAILTSEGFSTMDLRRLPCTRRFTAEGALWEE